MITETVYLFLVAVDTPISEREVMYSIKKNIDKTGFDNISKRVSLFIKYLMKNENDEFREYPEYLNNPLTNYRLSDFFENTIRYMDYTKIKIRRY